MRQLTNADKLFFFQLNLSYLYFKICVAMLREISQNVFIQMWIFHSNEAQCGAATSAAHAKMVIYPH